MQDARTRLEAILAERIAVLDGAWGVLIQREIKGEEAYRGERFKDHPRDVAGDPDLLNLTRPEVVLEIHRAYFAAGADIATTNTFTATSIGQADYGLQDAAYEMSVAGARLARQAADEVGGFVAGSVGPLNVTLSLSPRVDEPAFRTHTFDQARDAYAEQVRALAEGGVDFLLIETIFDTLNAKAAIAAAMDVAPELPRWISVTIVDRSGRTLSGQTIEAFWSSVEHAEPLIVGVNCSLGATEMRSHIEALARVAPVPVACYPNAGLPNAFGGYDETPEVTSGLLAGFARDGLANVLGGCCGTTDQHIRAIADAVRGIPRRDVPSFDERETREAQECPRMLGIAREHPAELAAGRLDRAPGQVQVSRQQVTGEIVRLAFQAGGDEPRRIGRTAVPPEAIGKREQLGHRLRPLRSPRPPDPAQRAHERVTRTTSCTVVVPSITLRSADSRRKFIPSSFAAFLISEAGRRSIIMPRIRSERSRSSEMAARPWNPVPLQSMQPVPSQNVLPR